MAGGADYRPFRGLCYQLVIKRWLLAKAKKNYISYQEFLDDLCTPLDDLEIFYHHLKEEPEGWRSLGENGNFDWPEGKLLTTSSAVLKGQKLLSK